MAYTKTTWNPGAAPGISADKLNNIENGIDSLHNGTITPDQTQVPVSPGSGTLFQLFNWFANRIKAITGKTNWYDAPDTTLAAAKTHIDAAAPHNGHALVNHTHLKSQITDFAHKSTHASSGADALTPADIGAVNKAGDTMTGNLTAPQLISNVSTGTAPLQVLSSTVVSNLNVDMIDSIHFRVYNGALQYNDGTGWKDIMSSPIKSIQRGIIESASTGDISITINAVDINKAVVITSGDGYSASATDISSWLTRYVVLTNSTTLTVKQRIYVNTGGWQNERCVSLAWQVIEYV